MPPSSGKAKGGLNMYAWRKDREAGKLARGSRGCSQQVMTAAS